jgi:hypothetical protein
MNSRYVGTLHKLCDNGPHKKGGWSDLLTYLRNCILSVTQKLPNPAFDSPLPPYTSPSPHLTKELLTREGARKEDTPLRIVCRTAPAHIIAALCHLCPEAAQKTDSRVDCHCIWHVEGPVRNAKTNEPLKYSFCATPVD